MARQHNEPTERVYCSDGRRLTPFESIRKKKKSRPADNNAKFIIIALYYVVCAAATDAVSV